MLVFAGMATMPRSDSRSTYRADWQPDTLTATVATTNIATRTRFISVLAEKTILAVDINEADL
ncbi:MAG TPA: hypothetical protein DCE43_00900 [Planctomycetaceae bacterium]|nr:hypothetical protein [Planctomycetaceae bacterium]|tara:strand:+ start:6594 stop:6782 length:189 start_codon:yes stop_codon:yes gene_type:complete